MDADTCGGTDGVAGTQPPAEAATPKPGRGRSTMSPRVVPSLRSRANEARSRFAGWPKAALFVFVLLIAEACVLFGGQLAYGSTVTSASFSGGAGTVTTGSPPVVYAKQGGALTLNVTTSSDTKCVDVTGGFTAHRTSSTAT